MPTGLSQLRTVLGSISPRLRGVLPGEQGNLQAINPNSKLIPSNTRAALEARRYACVCSIIVDRTGRGSGFLIADDLVMTNHHVVFDRDANKFFEPSLIKCRFNFFTDTQYQNDEYDWIALPEDENEAFAAYSPPAPVAVEGISLDERDYLDSATGTPFLDYAILRLTSPVGKEAGRTPLDVEVRPLGWIAMGDAPDFGEKLLVFQFPERVGTSGSFTQDPQQTSKSTFARVIANGLRVHYDASTRNGSSGSPVFDDTTLVGLHNAGEAADNTANNRFIPISRILKDLASRSPQLHAQVLNTPLPPIAAQQGDATAALNDRKKLAVDERIKAAQTLLDREQQNDMIQVKLRGSDAGTVHVNHVVCRDNDDQVDGFIERIKVGIAQREALTAADFIERYLCGSNAGEDSTQYWQHAGMSWPAPNTAPDEVRAIFRNALTTSRYASRTLITLTTNRFAKRSLEEEYAYIKILGEECARYVEARKVDPANAWQEIQTLVVYKVPLKTKIDLATIFPLWTTSPPPYCGVSFALPKVTQDDMEPWRVNINAAWKKSNTPIEFPAEFDPEGEFYMAQVVEMLKGPITRAAVALIR